jgi:hypothetical protein
MSSDERFGVGACDHLRLPEHREQHLAARHRARDPIDTIALAVSIVLYCMRCILIRDGVSEAGFAGELHI